MYGKRTILFIDEIHRFNKGQQDYLLPFVEDGTVILIGATTENPYFEVIGALLSRSNVFELKALAPSDVKALIERAMYDHEKGLGAYEAVIDEDALEFLADLAGGDARRALNAVELGVMTTERGSDGKIRITLAVVEECIQKRAILYDKGGDQHYDTISAFIKSMRGSDPDAAIYWLAKMLAGGEDPRFIARRLVILASEDVGLADPLALPLAVAAHHACDFVGLPECEYALAHATVYIACAFKSNSVTLALHAAKNEIATKPVQPVPASCRSTQGQANKRIGQGKDYLYAHDFPENISGQAYLETPVTFFTPKTAGSEARIAERLARWRDLRAAMREKTRD
jgi:putative ATPase